MPSTALVAYLILFSGTAAAFLFVSLLLGRFLRAHAPSRAKLQTYECGEIPQGSSFIQFDLRFYVVALVFLVFEVEVAFFFPWAVVFGKTTQLKGAAQQVQSAPSDQAPAWQATIAKKQAELGLPPTQKTEDSAAVFAASQRFAKAAMIDMAAFFAVLLVGFAYVWYRGDLGWVRALPHQPSAGQSA